MSEAFAIDHRSLLLLHLHVEEVIRKLIEKPEYQNGKLLPNGIHIAGKLGISRNTVRQATNKLMYEQLLVRKKGAGTKVVKTKITTRLNADSFPYPFDIARD